MKAASGMPLDSLPAIPRDEEGPVFRAPWEALAFSLAVKLHERGVFTWKEWSEALGAAIREAQAQGDPDLGDTYYLHWVKALEGLLIGRGLADAAQLGELAAAIAEDARHHRELQLAAGGRPVSTA